MRLAVIKDGFFGFLAQVFDSWAEYLRLRIKPRVEDKPVPGERDPFVSSPPEHWLELTDGLSFTDWGYAEETEDEPPALTGPSEISAASESVETTTAERPEANVSESPEAIEKTELPGTVKAVSRGAKTLAPPTVPPVLPGSPGSPGSSISIEPSARKPVAPAGSVFVEKRLATPAEVDFVSRKIHNAEKPAGFLNFSEKRVSETAKFVSPDKPPAQAPAAFLRPGLSPRSKEEAFVPGSGRQSEAAKNNFPEIVMGKNAVSLKPGNIVSQRGSVKAENSFVKKEAAAPAVAAVFTEPQIASEPLEAYFAKTGSSGSQNPMAGNFGEKFGEKFIGTVPASFSPNPADLSPQVIFAGRSGQPGVNENVFSPISARKEPVSGFRPAEKTEVKTEVKTEAIDRAPEGGFSARSKWSALPVLDLNSAAEIPEADHLRLRHLALLEREQKGERWSV